ncbi:Glutamine-dependent NAD(+) synthetase [Cymbomonas tetramitiformis]|uniref:NAD(+) synthase [glutamine-hydrolyzing] n=1 Tax=Cymbomonas tetramitiformis TaxID=36881 RepID=A0AAE0C336_9CHLO|nr:Glutamine-dependent NAD(+) synthetase [Cymbomonas tetramitiformis]
MRLITVATCNLNQWAMDFAGNLERISESIENAKKAGAAYRIGPELEIPGYGCEDHFLEEDTIEHSWESLVKILEGDLTKDIVCDIGMPVMHFGVRYNCRVFCLNHKILLIRPKFWLANDGNYRETRYFAVWSKKHTVEEHRLPATVRAVCGQRFTKFGDAILEFNDTRLASETCEELFTPAAPHIDLVMNGVEIIANGSGSHHQLRKLDQRMQLIQSATAKV